MPRINLSILSLSSLGALALACGGGGANPGGPPMAGMPGGGPGGAGGGMVMPPGPMGGGGSMGRPVMMMPPMKPGMTGAAGVIVIGIPTPGSPGTVFPGGGPSGSAPLAPGCTPASAHECPTASGICATSAASKPTGTSIGSICFYGPSTTTTTTTSSAPAATIEYLHETVSGQEYYRFRITFDPAFVDNTYGANAIGCVQRGHTFKDLVGSDHAELLVFDGTSKMVTMFDIDYITANAASTCAYGALGVSGGEGKMLVGDTKYVLGSTSSLDRNLMAAAIARPPRVAAIARSIRHRPTRSTRPTPARPTGTIVSCTRCGWTPPCSRARASGAPASASYTRRRRRRAATRSS